MTKDNRQLNVLYVTHDSKMYGANQSLLNLINGLSDEVVPYVLLAEEGPLRDELEKRGIKYLYQNYKQCGWWHVKSKPDPKWVVVIKGLRAKIVNYFAVRVIFKKLKQVKFDVIHSNSSVVDIGVSLAQQFGCRHVWHFREFQDLDHGFYLFDKKEKFVALAKKSGDIICITSSVARHFDLEGKAHTIFDGVRPDAPDVILEKEPYFIFCGAIKKQKGIEDALHAFSLVIQSGQKIGLKVAGGIEDAYRASFQAIIDELSLGKHIEVLGFRNDVDELIRHSKALLMCSKNEAMGRVTVEAMLLGCPVIGYNSQGTAELIDHGRTGYLYNDVPELADYMNKILNEENVMPRITMQARTYALDNFLDAVSAKKVLKIYALT